MRATNVVLAIIIALAIAGCGESTGPADRDDGVYAAVRYGGQSLPTASMVSLRAELGANGSLVWRYTVRDAGKDLPSTEIGVWSRDGDVLRLTTQTGSDTWRWDCTRSGDRLTCPTWGGGVEFERQ